MHADQPSVRREESIFGVCAALGQDFGFNPTWLRLALALLVLLNPVAFAIGYAAAGVIVVVSRWIYPNRRPAGTRDLQPA